MNNKDLAKIEGSLPRGGKWRLSQILGCDPSKITKAFAGMVRDPVFLGKLKQAALKIADEYKPLV